MTGIRAASVGSKLLRSTVKSALASKWGWRVATPLLRRRGVSVLMYHRIVEASHELDGVPVEAFERQMQWLKQHCEIITPDTLVDRAIRPNRTRAAVLVTFDDGYRDYHDLAYPVLKHYGIPALMFLPTSHIDTGQPLWTNHVQRAVLSTARSSIRLPWSDGDTVALPDARARAQLAESVRGRLKTLPDFKRQEVLAELLVELGEPPACPREMMTWDEVRTVSDLTWFGGHSHSHPILSRLTREGLEREISKCRDRIAAETGRSPIWFAYPNGQPEDYNAETQTVLKQQGFNLAFSTTEGIAGPATEWLAIPRIAAMGDVSTAPLAWRIAGMHLR